MPVYAPVAERVLARAAERLATTSTAYCGNRAYPDGGKPEKAGKAGGSRPSACTPSSSAPATLAATTLAPLRADLGLRQTNCLTPARQLARRLPPPVQDRRLRDTMPGPVSHGVAAPWRCWVDFGSISQVPNASADTEASAHDALAHTAGSCLRCRTAMALTVSIRYQIDPFQRDAFARHARCLGRIICAAVANSLAIPAARGHQ